jgi:hypothetical protein
MKILVVIVNIFVICVGIIGLTDMGYIKFELLYDSVIGPFILFGIPLVNLIYVYYNSRIINELNLMLNKEKFWKEKMK